MTGLVWMLLEGVNGLITRRFVIGDKVIEADVICFALGLACRKGFSSIFFVGDGLFVRTSFLVLSLWGDALRFANGFDGLLDVRIFDAVVISVTLLVFCEILDAVMEVDGCSIFFEGLGDEYRFGDDDDDEGVFLVLNRLVVWFSIT